MFAGIIAVHYSMFILLCILVAVIVSQNKIISKNERNKKVD